MRVFSGELVFDGFDEDGGTVGDDFADALHDFSGVVADGDDGVGAELSGVEGHHGVGVLAGFFAELGEDGDVAADEGLETGADGAEQVAGSDDDAANDADVADDTVTGDFEGGGDESWVEGWSWRWVGGHFGFRLSRCCERLYVRGWVGVPWRQGVAN
jgi:hypothetical protein